MSERRSIEGCLAYLTWPYARLTCEEQWWAHPWGLLSVERGATSNAWLTKLRKVSEEVAASRFDPAALNRPTDAPPGPRRRVAPR